MDKYIELLEKKFLKIKKMEYVKTVRNGPTGVGATFEYLLGKTEDSFEIPDYLGIEIKTKRSYSKSYISLFNAVPTGSHFHETKRLRDIYGYPSKNNKLLKELYVDVFSTFVSKVGLWYYFQLYVDDKNQRLFLLVYDYQKQLIDDSVYWDFDVLQEKLVRKLQILALVKAWPNRINHIEYFKYYKMSIYVLKDFNHFIEAIRKGVIKLSLKIGSYNSSDKFGMVKEHGISFCIREEDLLEIFDIYR